MKNKKIIISLKENYLQKRKKIVNINSDSHEIRDLITKKKL